MFFAHPRARQWRARHHAFHHPGPHRGPGPHGGAGGGGGFGVRRPLRFLMDRLGLDDVQISEVGKLLEDFRLDREQAALDRRRSAARVADLFASETLDTAALDEAADARLDAARRQRDALVALVTKLHAVLKPDQRLRLATLLRTGPISL